MNKTGVLNITIIAFEDVDPKEMNKDNDKIRKALKKVTMHTVRECVEDSFRLFDIKGQKAIPVMVKDHIIMCDESSDIVYDEKFIDTCADLNNLYKNMSGNNDPAFGKGAAICINNVVGFTTMEDGGFGDMIKDMVENYDKTVYNITIVVNPSVVKGFIEYRDNSLAAMMVKHGFGDVEDVDDMDILDREFIARKVNECILKFPTHAFLNMALDKAMDKMKGLDINVYTHACITTTDKVESEDLINGEFLNNPEDMDNYDEEPCDIFGVDEGDFDEPPYKYLN